jgi:hypothetical protein
MIRDDSFTNGKLGGGGRQDGSIESLGVLSRNKKVNFTA